MRALSCAGMIVLGLLIVFPSAQATSTSKPSKRTTSGAPAVRQAVRTQSLPKMLVIGTKHTPPFVIKQSNGQWSGISIDLWKEVAAHLNIAYKFREYNSLSALLQSIPKKEVHLIVSPLTITLERESYLDFTYPFYSTGLGIAYPVANTGSLFRVWSSLFSLRYLKYFFGLFAVLILLGIGVWWVERAANPKEFGGTLPNCLG